MSGNAGLPPKRQVAKATLVAILAATISYILFNLDVVAAGPNILAIFLIFGVPLAALHALLLGWPLYLLLRGRWQLRWWHAALAGFLIGAVPLLLLNVASGPGVDFYGTSDAVLIEHGQYTAVGWASMLMGAAVTGLAGLVGGLAFWAMLRGSGSCR
jgi:hypothetical protein